MSIDKIFTISISLIAFILSIYNFNRSRVLTLYQDVDKLYMDLLKLGITNPKFVNQELTLDYKKKLSGNDQLGYELYAFMAWNICETIFDRKSSENFFKTWGCIIKVENRLHRTWLEDSENKKRFKEDFIKYIKHHLPVPEKDNSSDNNM